MAHYFRLGQSSSTNDITGSMPNSTVVSRLQGTPLNFTGLASNQVFRYNGTAFVNSAIDNDMVTGVTALPDVATVGTISTGVWNGTSIAYNYGGTGSTAAFVQGGVAYGSSTSALGVTPVGVAGEVLVSGGAGAPTWTSSPTFSAVTISSGGNLSVSDGGTVTGLPLAPAGLSDAASKAYVDATVSGLSWKQTADYATAGPLPSAVYVNGADGVGATLTADAPGVLSIDGADQTVAGIRLLIKNESNAALNGIYVLTTPGTAGVPFVLTRSGDADLPAELNNAALFITRGADNGGSAWTQTTVNPVFGTSSIVFAQFAAATLYTAGTGLSLVGNTFSISAPVASNLGGTGTTVAPTAGQLMVGQTGGTYVPFTVLSGTGISTIAESGTFQIDNTGVTQLAGTANQVAISASTGNVTLSLPSAVATGSLTLSGLTENSYLYSGTSGLLTSTAAPANGQILIGSTGAAPSLAALTQGTGITITNGAGSISIANAGVTSLAGTAGRVSVSAPTGSVTLDLIEAGTAGTYGQVTTDAYGRVTSGLAVAGVVTGGTGTSVAPTAGQVLIGTTEGVYAPATMGSGSGISITTSSGGASIANTGVLSLAGTSSEIVVSSSTGAVTLSLPSDVAVANSLTVEGHTSNSFLLSGAGGLLTSTSAPTNGQLLIGSTGAAPVVASLIEGTGISITTGAGSISLANTGVLSLSTGTTGLSVSGSTGSVTLSGVLVNANGGTGSSADFVQGGVAFGSSSSVLGTSAAGTVGELMVSGGTGSPSWLTNVPAGSVVASAGVGYSPVFSSSPNVSNVLLNGGGATPVLVSLLVPNNFYAEEAGVPVGGLYRSRMAPPASTSDLTVVTASITNTTLTVTAVSSGPLFGIGSLIRGDSILPNTYITAFGTGSGGVGTYEISESYPSATPTAVVTCLDYPDVIYIRTA